MQVKIGEPHPAGVILEAGTSQVGDSAILAMDAKAMQVLAAPGEGHLADLVELGGAGVATDQQATPDQWADATAYDAESMGAQRLGRLTHGSG